MTCIEQQSLLDPNSSPLFTPLPVKEGSTPLQQCVLSFSQFSGTEKDTLTDLAKLLGARYVVHYLFSEICWHLVVLYLCVIERGHKGA